MEITKIKIGSSIYDVKDANAIGSSDVTKIINNEIYGSDEKPNGASVVTSENIAAIAQEAGIGGTGGDGDTLNTAGSTNTDSKIYIVGATTQSFSAQTYSNSNCYIQNNSLYTNGEKAVNSTDVANAIYTELYGSTTKPNGASVVTSENIDDIIQNSGIGSGSGVSTYAQLLYGVSRVNGSGSLTIAGTDPVYVVTVSSNISSVSLQNNPVYGHSCHVIFKSADSSSYTVVIANDSTNRICPSSSGMTLTVPASGSGYTEVDFLNCGNSNVGDEIYVRGV